MGLWPQQSSALSQLPVPIFAGVQGDLQWQASPEGTAPLFPKGRQTGPGSQERPAHEETGARAPAEAPRVARPALSEAPLALRYLSY